MSNFTFKLPSGESFEIKAPNGTTFDQAKAIFDQQASSGGLVGFKVGDALSAATQAADGLAAAQGQLSQGLAGLAGKLPAGADLSSLTASLGTTGAAAAGQLSSALSGSIPAISSTITGASAGINSAISGATAALPGAIAGFNSQLPAAIGALTGQAAQIGSLANQAVTGLSKAISGVPTDGINVSDFTKQLPALGDIGGLSKTNVTGVLAQASKLVGQASDQISSALGAGKFGFDANQLEKAGLVKPGTAAAFLAQGDNDLVDVLKSPTVWTGKDGVKNLDGLLSNSALQDKVQQGLMSTGLTELKSLGVPTDALKPQALAGLATNAAKSVTDTLKWATGSGAVPGLPNLPGVPALPADLTAKFNSAATNGAFAVNLVEEKVEPPAKQEEIVEPAANTVDTATVTAAAERVVGNDKVPSILPDGSVASAKTTVIALLRFIGDLAAQAETLTNTVDALNARSSISQEEWNTVNQELQVIRATYNARSQDLINTTLQAVNSLPDTATGKAKLVAAVETAKKNAVAFVNGIQQLKKLVADLANKIAT